MDYIDFCKNYFAVTNLPINLVNEDEVLFSSLGDLLGLTATNPTKIYPSDFNPEFRAQDPDIVYGAVKIEATGDYIMLGPAFSFPPDPFCLLACAAIFCLLGKKNPLAGLSRWHLSL